MENEAGYLPFKQSLLVTICLCFTLFCVSLDETILATAIPRITDQFHSLKDVGWYGSSYLFVFTATQMVWGKLYTMYASKWVFLLGVAIFEIGSLICGIAPTSTALIAGRSIAGLGAGSINAGAIVIITDTVPLRKRPIYMGCLGCIHGVVSVSGPMIGGLLTDHVSWRWCFYINLPLGFVTLLVILFCLPTNKPPSGDLGLKRKIQSMDLLGLLFLIPGIVTLLLALGWGGSEYAWDSWRIIILFVLSGILLIVFAGVQVWAKDQATLPPRIVANRNMLGIIWFSISNSGALFIFVYYLPIWFQAIKGVSASKSGLLILPTQLGLVISSLLGGVLVTVVGYYTPFLIVSSILSAVGAGLLSTLHPSSTSREFLGYQVLLSAGIGIGGQNAMLVPQVAVAGEDVVMAIATLCFVQTLSSSIFLVIGQTVFHNRLIENLRANAPSVDRSMVEESITSLRDNVPSRYLGIVLEVCSRAITQTFYIAVAMCVLSLAGSASLQWNRVNDKTATERQHNTSITTSPVEGDKKSDGQRTI